MDKLSTWLWFDTEAEDAANFYVDVFPDAKITGITRYGSAGPRPEGMVMTASWEVFGHSFNGLNGGPDHKLEGYGVSIMVLCDDQAEVDRYWDKLADGGKEIACGWVSDKYGLTWQIVPKRLQELLADPDPARAQRAMGAMLEMTKIVIADLEAAADNG